jgi:hypothetical protein
MGILGRSEQNAERAEREAACQFKNKDYLLITTIQDCRCNHLIACDLLLVAFTKREKVYSHTGSILGFYLCKLQDYRALITS